MTTTARPFLMFEGRAGEAIDFYVATLPGGEILDMKRYGPEGPGPEGSIMRARFRVAGQEVIASDTYVKHAFTFTPSISFFVDCDSEAELERLAAVLGEGGQVYMPVGDYGFSKKFAWVGDRFGVTWQLNLP
jgi:predicted 3-demethylubiquinone-9 3-methyltransferase (glyoxalase superfamily)